MLVYQVEDMTCGHCAAAITQAVRGVDEGARVQVDLAQRRVTVEATDAEPDDLLEAITRAGYNPVRSAATQPAVSPARPGGCGCGGSRCGA